MEVERSPKGKWKRQVEEESINVGLNRKDVFCRSKWNDSVDHCH